MKILNLYAGIGGNRKLWGDEHEVTAIENHPGIAKIYQDFFPGDKVIVTDAHEYLLEHFKEFDFIWSSPPCPTHSVVRWKYVNSNMTKKSKVNLQPKYPEMELYQEIILLDKHFKGKWVVENVRSYYVPLIPPQELGKHYFWSNENLGSFKLKTKGTNATIKEKQRIKGFDLSKYKGIYKQGILRNCVESNLALHIFNMCFKIKQVTLSD